MEQFGETQSYHKCQQDKHTIKHFTNIALNGAFPCIVPAVPWADVCEPVCVHSDSCSVLDGAGVHPNSMEHLASGLSVTGGSYRISSVRKKSVLKLANTY